MMRLLLLKGLAALFITALSLFLVEIGYRLLIFGRDTFSYEKLNSVKPIGVAGLLQGSEDGSTLFELKPNLDTYYKLVKFETNSHGLRDKAYSLAKPKRTIRVSVIGDSWTMPSGVPIEDAYHTLLENRFNRRGSDLSYEFLNFGVAGYNLQQYLSVMETRSSKFDPDLILLGFCTVNDHKPPRERKPAGGYKPKKAAEPFYESFALKTLHSSWITFSRERVHHDPSKPALSNEEGEYIQGIFSKMSSFSQRSRVPILVANLWTRSRGPRSAEIFAERAGLLEDIAARENLYFVDVGSAFKKNDPTDYRIYPADVHPNAAANRVFADRIYEYMEETRLLKTISESALRKPVGIDETRQN